MNVTETTEMKKQTNLKDKKTGPEGMMNNERQ